MAGAGATMSLGGLAASAVDSDNEGHETTSIQPRSVWRKPEDALAIPASLELSDSEGEFNQAPQPVASAKRHHRASRASAARGLDNGPETRREPLSAPESGRLSCP